MIQNEFKTHTLKDILIKIQSVWTFHRRQIAHYYLQMCFGNYGYTY